MHASDVECCDVSTPSFSSVKIDRFGPVGKLEVHVNWSPLLKMSILVGDLPEIAKQ